MAQTRQDRGIGRRRGAQIERLAFVRERDRRRAKADHAGRRFIHAVFLHDQIRGHHIARQRAVLHAAPFALPADQVDLRAVRHARQDGGRRRRLLAQIQAVQRVFEGHDSGFRVRNRFLRRLRRGRRAVDAAKQCARHGVARARQAWIIEFEDLVIGKAFVGHLLRAALAHAHAVAKAPRRQLIAADSLRHGQRLVFQYIDGQGAKPLDLGKVIQRHRHVAVPRKRQADLHLGVYVGRFGVLRFGQRHAVDGRDLHAVRADEHRRLRAKQLGQCGNAGRAVAIKRDRFGDGSAVAQIVGVVLHLQIAV